MPPKLLLADESATVQRVIELTFAQEGIDVIVAGSGAEAMAAVESERPDIVLADINMLDPDGYPVSAFIKGHPQLGGVPVVLLSSALEPLDEARMRQAACDGVLAKPFEPQAVVSLVRALLGRRAQHLQAALPDDAATGAAATSPVGEEADPLAAYFDRLDAAFSAFAAASGGRDSDHANAAPQPSFANAFVSMFQPESGRPAAVPAIPDEVIDEIVRRVVAKLGEESMRRLVLDTAERIVREEVERIKQAGASGPTHAAG